MHSILIIQCCLQNAVRVYSNSVSIIIKNATFKGYNSAKIICNGSISEDLFYSPLNKIPTSEILNNNDSATSNGIVVG